MVSALAFIHIALLHRTLLVNAILLAMSIQERIQDVDSINANTVCVRIEMRVPRGTRHVLFSEHSRALPSEVYFWGDAVLSLPATNSAHE